MLESLYVKNLALIDRSEVCFTSGLNILSGETGAGKSILIGSVLMALGAKAPRDMIRTNETEAYIELVFSVHTDSVLERLKQMEIVPEDGHIIISRRITGSRSLCRINGESVTAAKVREAASFLIDIHGQHEHQALLYPARQLEILDRCDKKQIEPLRHEVGRLYLEYERCREELKKSAVDESMRMRTEDILRFEIDELESAHISPGEEQQLEQEWRRLRSQEQIQNGLSQILACLSFDQNGAGELVENAELAAKELMLYDESFNDLYNQLMDAESILRDCCHAAEHGLPDEENTQERFHEISVRLDEIRHLTQKYNCDEYGLIQLLENKQTELDGLLHIEETKQKLEQQAEQIYQQLEQKAMKLTELRTACSQVLTSQLTAAMIDLNFLDVRFEIRMKQTGEIGHNGRDSIEFYIATNPGEQPKPLAMVASGGELSRIMLAIKSVLAENEETETLIFDEIDAGISGRTAQKVASRLSVTAKNSQVICISHLPQIVSMADTHFLIDKEAKDQVTTTHIRQLSNEESVVELARLLGGTSITERVLENAREMKEMAQRQKDI